MRSGPFRQHVQRFEDRKTCFDQCVELLVEDQEIVLADFAAIPRPRELADDIEVVANGVDVVASFAEFLASFGLGLRRLQLLGDAARRVSDFAYEFGHILNGAAAKAGRPIKD